MLYTEIEVSSLSDCVFANILVIMLLTII